VLVLADDQYVEAISKIQKTNFIMLKSMLEKFGEVLEKEPNENRLELLKALISCVGFLSAEKERKKISDIVEEKVLAPPKKKK